jgi:hypothetical protein
LNGIEKNPPLKKRGIKGDLSATSSAGIVTDFLDTTLN